MSPRVAAAIALAAAVLGCRTAGPWEAVAPDQRTRVSISTRGGRQCVAVGARADGCYAGVSVDTLVLGPSGHTAYAVSLGKRWAIVHDGRVGASWEGVGPPRLSPDGTRLAYPALDGGRWRVVVDGVPGEPFDAVLADSLRFDPTGASVAFAATRGSQVFVVDANGRSRPWAEVAQLQFDPSGSHLGYSARAGWGTRVVIDGWVGPPHTQVGELALGGTRAPTPLWAAPAHSAYAARETGPWRVRVDGASGPPFDDIRELRILPQGGAVYVGSRDGRETLVRGDQAVGWHDRVVTTAFAPDGRWGYVARDGERSRVILDGAVAAEGAWATDLALGDAGRHAYVIEHAGHAAVVDEGGRHAFDLVVAGSLQYVAGGRVWTCLVGDQRRHELYVVADGARVGSSLDWTEVVRDAHGGGGAAAVRAWVAGQAERALAEQGPAGR